MKEQKKLNQTDIWCKYEKCKSYADKKSLLTKSEKCWNFYIGNQWKGLNSGGEELPLLNMIKPIVQYKVSSVAQNAMTAIYSDMESRSELADVYNTLNLYWQQCWEKAKMNNMAWKMLKSAAIQGDSYMYWADGDTLSPPQIIPNTSVYLSDENIDDIQDQEYIIIYERWSLKAAKRIAKENGVSDDDLKKIMADNQTERQLYNREEVDEKVTVLLYMEKDKDGIVRTGRATEQVVIEPIEAKVNKSGEKINSKLTVYPVIPYVWESTPNSARGVGEVEQLIPNQLELNKTLARRAMAVKMAAYPRLAYDANAIENPEDLEKVGVAIAMQGGNAQSINQMIGYLNPANTSSDALQLSAELLQNTKDLAGATDYALGNINPEQASGTAIIAVRDQAQVPLSEQVARFRQWVEDVSLLWFDLWAVYNTEGITFEYESETGEKQIGKLSQKEILGLKPTVRIDVSPDNMWTKQAEQQSLDGMLMNQQITFEEYVEMTPENSSVPKGKLKKILEKRKIAMEQQQNQMLDQQIMAKAETQTDPNMILQELVKKGISEEDAQQMVQNYMGGGGETTDTDPNMVLQQLINRGIPEDEARRIVEEQL